MPVHTRSVVTQCLHFIFPTEDRGIDGNVLNDVASHPKLRFSEQTVTLVFISVEGILPTISGVPSKSCEHFTGIKF